MTKSTLFKLALPAVVALGAGTAVALATIPSTSDQVIHACYSPTATTRVLRVIDTENGEACTGAEATLTWNQQGPIGPQGDPGPPGDSGTGTDTSGGGGFGSGGGSPFDPSQAGGPSADIFLALDGIPGDSADANHKNEIALESFAFLAKRPTSPPGSTKLSSLRLDKVYDVSSPRLFAAATSGRRIKSAVLTFSTGSDTTGTDVLTYKLTDVTVTSYEQGGVNPDTKPLGSLEEEVGLRAARVTVTEKRLDAGGKPGPPVTATWNVPRSSKR